MKIREMRPLLGAALLALSALAFAGCSDADDVENRAGNTSGAQAPASSGAAASPKPQASSPALDSSLKGKGEIQASPTTVSAGDSKGTTKISWRTTGDVPNVNVFVSKDGEAENKFAASSEGTGEAPWIVAGSTYEFRLYSGDGPNRKLISKVTVTGVR